MNIKAKGRCFIIVFKDITLVRKNKNKIIGAVNTNIIDKKSRITKNTYSFILPSKCIVIEETLVDVSLLRKKYHMKGSIK
jgi:hypothetical protein|tara:strand:- start:327 stop:566 length:240 start_codon:yes stop_codon:yes gene_type:complete